MREKEMEEVESVKVFTHTQLPENYAGRLGPQLWIPRAWFRQSLFTAHQVGEVLNRASKWQREDKTSGRCRSWEFHKNETVERVARELQEKYGFKLLEPNDFFEKYGH